ncbi:MAG: Multimeric flavodoxin WrbA [Promethearchaeota archaeon]|nr:MAG: Multimeric flavodoxin WrbA [Candidatus Lokiarchaeota archaeon]
MKALLLNGMRDLNVEITQIHDKTMFLLRTFQFHVNDVPLKDRKIAPCLGCFECWVKTPGICKINDYGQKLAELMVQSDLVIHLTPITFGGYSSKLKAVIDRSIPIILPFFRKHKGEIHHKQRYKNRACLIVIGYQENGVYHNEETFKKLIYRNSLNMAPPVYHVQIVKKGQDLSEFHTELKACLEEVRAHLE